MIKDTIIEEAVFNVNGFKIDNKIVYKKFNLEEVEEIVRLTVKEIRKELLADCDDFNRSIINARINYALKKLK